MTSLLANQFVSGGFILMGGGAAMALLRQVPVQIYGWVKRRFSVTLTIIDKDPLFEWTEAWLDSLPYAKDTRNVKCSLVRDDEEEFGADSKTVFVPGYGEHFFRHNGRFIWLSRTEEKSDGSSSTVSSKKSKESFEFTVLGADQNNVRQIIRDIVVSQAEQQKQHVRAYISNNGWWRKLPNFAPRKFDTVDMPAQVSESLLRRISSFLTSRQDYAAKGIPYHLNLLFYGPPGTGKTSLASALAGKFGLGLHILNIAGPGMNDDRLVSLMAGLPRRSILLMEDVDCVVPDRSTKPTHAQPSTPNIDGIESENTGVTLSGLLNCMDGITAPDGSIIIMTTNFPERLDTALTRAGRVDMKIEFGYATSEQIRSMAGRFTGAPLPEKVVQHMLDKKYTTADLQGALLSGNLTQGASAWAS